MVTIGYDIVTFTDDDIFFTSAYTPPGMPEKIRFTPPSAVLESPSV
jgi:hypothetical protein